MCGSERLGSLSSFLVVLWGFLSVLTEPSSCSTETFVFSGCTTQKYIPESPYESNLNSLLNHLVNSAASISYSNFTVPSSAPQYTAYGLFQCRGDLISGDCSSCVARAVSQLGTICTDSCGGALQLEGCFVKYDNKAFIGVEDKTLVLKKCGSPVGFESDPFTRLDSALSYLGTGGGAYRTSADGDVLGVAQCTSDLSPSECQDCLSDAIGRLKGCGPYASGDVYLATCYARFTRGAGHAQPQGGYPNKESNDNGNGVNKTLAIIIGLFAVVALFILFITFINKKCEKRKGCK